MYFAQIILPLNLKGTFTYKVPNGLLGQIDKGIRVLVSFSGKKIYTGIIAEIYHSVIKEITKLDRVFIISF